MTSERDQSGPARNLELERLKTEVAELRVRERAARSEAERAKRQLRDFVRMSDRFASSMRAGAEERRRSRRRLNVQYAVANVLAEAGDLEEAASRVFEVFRDLLGWEAGVLWLAEGGALRCARAWRTPEGPVSGFEAACRRTSFRSGTGLPGRVWARGEPVWVEDTGRSDEPRLREAAREGLRGACAFPVRDGGFTGVMELFSREKLSPNESAFHLTNLVGYQIGEFADKRRAEQERDRTLDRERKMRRQLDAILESINDAFFALDRNWRFTYVNRRAERFWSKSREELLGKKIWEEFPQAVGLEIYREIRRAMRERVTTGFEAVSPVMHRWISGRVYPTPDGGLSVYFQDVTNRKEAEEALRLSEERYRSLVTASASIVWTSDAEGRVVEEIPSWQRFTGQTFEEYRGFGWLEGVHPDDRERAVEGRKLTVQAKKPFKAEYRLRSRAGSYRHTVVRGVPIRDEDGEVSEWVGTIIDITERKKAEEALKESEARLAADLAGMRRLYDLHARLANETDLMTALDEILAVAVELAGTDRGTVQLLRADGESLEIVTHHGHSARFIEHFRHQGFKQGCDAAKRDRKRLIIEDVRTFPGLVGTEDGEVTLADGVLAAQSTPMITRRGEMVGVLSTQYPRPYRPADHELRMLDLLAWTAADFVERHRADAVLRESEERFRALTTASSYVVYRMRPDWSRMEELAGQGFVADTESPSEDWLTDYIYPDDRPLVTEAIEEAIRAKSTFELEHRVRRADGALGWTLSRAVPLLDPDGEIREWFGAASDVTARRRAEEALRESEERYRTLFEAMDEGYAVVEMLADEDGAWNDFLFVEVNPAFEKQAGIKRPVGRKATEILGTPNTAWAEIFGRIVETGEPVRFEESEPTLGRVFDLYAFRLGGEGSRRVAVLFTDITGRKKAEEALRESEERFRTVIEQSPLAIHVFAPDGASLRSNRAWKEIWELEESPANASVFDDERVRAAGLTPVIEKGAAGVETATKPMLYNPARAGLEGEPRWLEAFVYPVRSEGGRVSEVVLMLEDVTERKKAEEERERLRSQEWTARAEAAERERTSRELHDRVAHSMGVVHQSLQLYEALADIDPPRAAAKLELAKEMAKSSLDTTRNLSAELRRSETEEGLEPALRNLLKVTVPDAIHRELSVGDEDLTLPEPLRGQVYLILREAVRNAVRHSGCASIKVGLHIGPEAVAGSVEDDGRGFVDNGGEVAGLGLRSMRERAALLAGTCEVYSTPGSGTRVEVRVPLQGDRGG